MPSRQELIAIRNIRKSISNRTVLNVEELVVYQSECVVVHGENGAGKSMLLKILAGLVAPDSGVVSVNGRTLSWRQAYRIFRTDVVYLHQSPYLFDRTVEENIAYGLQLRNHGRNEVRRQVAKSLEWAALTHLAKRNARELSGGERQRVALTRARILSPRLLLLDEPTAAMDQSSRDQAFSLIRDLAVGGNAVYIATHESPQNYQPNRLLELKNGELVS